VTKDEKEAASYYRKAADLGDSAAMVNMANMLRPGGEVPPNPDEAAGWIYRALASGYGVARDEMRKNAASWSLPFRKALQRVMKENGKYSGPLEASSAR